MSRRPAAGAPASIDVAQLAAAADDLTNVAKMLDLIQWVVNAKVVTDTVSTAAKADQNFRETLEGYGITHDVASESDSMHEGLCHVIGSAFDLVLNARLAVTAASQRAANGGPT